MTETPRRGPGFYGRHTILGEDGSPYMTRYWIGRLRLHIFYRGDLDPDPHDHPWGFWTFPLTSYVEEVSLPNRFEGGVDRHIQLVKAWHWNYRPADHCHRVLGRWDRSRRLSDKKIITIVWREKESRKWGFLKMRDGRTCWQYWRDYLNGGRHAPCSEATDED